MYGKLHAMTDITHSSTCEKKMLTVSYITWNHYFFNTYSALLCGL